MNRFHTAGQESTAAGDRNLLAHIRSLYPSLTRAERRVADRVLQDAREIIYGSVTDLAERAEVGETSVLRFCRHIGHSGFQEFKLALAQELVRPEVNDSEKDGEQATSLYDQLTGRNIRLIEETAAFLEEEELNRSVEMLLQAKRIIFFGVGSSGLTAEDARYRFLRVGLVAEAIPDSHLATVRASLLGADDLLVAVSVSGSTVDTVDVTRLAKENGAMVICITNHARSPITRLADVLLLGSSREGPTEGSALSSKMVQLHILDLLFAAVLLELDDRGRELLQITAESVSKKLY